MKAISLWQPWATAIAYGSKRIETRSWVTAHRGLIAIHAGKRCVADELLHIQCSWGWCGALRPFGLTMGADHDFLKRTLPFGALVAVAELVDCRPTESFTLGELEAIRQPEGERDGCYAWTERMLGDFSPGRFGWVLENVVMLAEPFPCLGAQRLFNLPDPIGEVMERVYQRRRKLAR